MRYVHALLALTLLPLYAACAAPDSGADRSALLADETKPGGCGDTPGGPDEPPVCTGGVLGDGVTCLDPGDVKDAAYAACVAAGLEIVALDVVSDGCGGLVTFAKYTCCSAPPPPSDPGPSACFDGEVGDGLACQSAADLKVQAIDACGAAGGQLADIWLAEGCPDGESSKAGFSCCLPQPSPDPDPQPEPDPK